MVGQFSPHNLRETAMEEIGERDGDGGCLFHDQPFHREMKKKVFRSKRVDMVQGRLLYSETSNPQFDHTIGFKSISKKKEGIKYR